MRGKYELQRFKKFQTEKINNWLTYIAIAASFFFIGMVYSTYEFMKLIQTL